MLPPFSKLSLQRPCVPCGTPVKFVTVEDQQKDHEALFMETMRREHNYDAYMTQMTDDAKRRAEEHKAKAIERAEREAAEGLASDVQKAKELFEQTAIDKFGPEYRARFEPRATLQEQIEAKECSICMEKLGVSPSNATAPLTAGVEPWVEVCGRGHYIHRWCLSNVMVRGADQCPDCREPITAAAKDFVRAAYPYEGADAVVQAPPPSPPGDDLMAQIDFGDEVDVVIDETEDGLGRFTREQFAAALTPGQIIRQRDAVEAIMRLGRALAAVTEERTDETTTETRASMGVVLDGLRAWRTWRVVFDPEWVPHPAEEPVPRFADMLGEISKNLVLGLMHGIYEDDYFNPAASDNLIFAVFIAKLGDLVPAMRPVLLEPPGINGGLMRALPDYADGVEAAFFGHYERGEEWYRHAREAIDRMRDWAANPGAAAPALASSSTGRMRMITRVQETVRAIVEAGNRIYGRNPAEVGQMLKDAVINELNNLEILLDDADTNSYFYLEAHWSALRDAIDTAHAMLLVYEQDPSSMRGVALAAIKLFHHFLTHRETFAAPTMHAYIRQRITPAVPILELYRTNEEEPGQTTNAFAQWLLDELAEPSSSFSPATSLQNVAIAPLPLLRRNSSDGYESRARARARTGARAP